MESFRTIDALVAAAKGGSALHEFTLLLAWLLWANLTLPGLAQVRRQR